MPERELWQEVLLRQIADARLTPDSWPVPARYIKETAAAREYLTTPSNGLSTVCSLAGVNMEALVDRMRKRLADVPPVEIMSIPLGRPSGQPTRTAVQRLEHDGQSLTFQEWSARTGIAVKVIRNRLRAGWPVSDALTISADQSRQIRAARKALSITYAGETLTVRQWSERTGINKLTIRERHKKGWLAEDVLRAA